MDFATVDFETAPIEDRPRYPPEPAGVAIKLGNKKSRYLAWGHPTKNNVTKKQALAELAPIWRTHALVMHNAKFDLDVAQEHLGLAVPSWERIHDTLFLLFLKDPHEKNLSLKPSAERLLGLPPVEQDAVHDWLVGAGVVAKGDKRWGAHICKAPGDIVGRYAIGDVDRTWKLFQLLHTEIDKRDMMAAYARERKLLPILLRNEQKGIRVDRPALERDVGLYQKEKEKAEVWLRKRLKAPALNLDADADVAKALRASGVVESFAKTKTGRDSVSKKNLTPDRFTDPKVAQHLGYRNALQTLLGTFMETWLRLSEHDGHIHTSWNQVRQGHGAEGLAGARTGRMSSSPSMLNIPKEFSAAIQPKTLLPLPFMRRYALPDPGGVWLRRDYSQQEFRILAHYEDDALLAAYQSNPKLDIHDWLQRQLREVVGLEAPRKDVKILNFADIYGMGLGTMAEKLKVDVATVQQMRAAKRRLMPGLKTLQDGIRENVALGLPIRTWGGREYFCEPKKWNGERWLDFAYKLLNYLIQGSAGDCTKEAIIRMDDAGLESRFLVAVHDELNTSAPRAKAKKAMAELREVMASVEFAVTMLSDGESGPNWHELIKEA